MNRNYLQFTLKDKYRTAIDFLHNTQIITITVLLKQINTLGINAIQF